MKLSFVAAAAAAVGGALAGEVTVGNVRVQALSPTLLRVEPRGPVGFEDRTTFVVTGRNFSGIPLRQTGSSGGTTTLATDFYTVDVTQHQLPNGTCANSMSGTDVAQGTRTIGYPNGTHADDQASCCSLCSQDEDCAAYVYVETSGTNCYPLSGFVGTKKNATHHFGCVRGCSGVDTIIVKSPSGEVLYKSSSPASPLLHWPSPLKEKSYAFSDRPRFHVPEWGPRPIPTGAKVEPALVKTNGYDFRNNVEGDTYIFLLGSTLEDWKESRKEFLKLTGNVPVLPDFAWGTWFTWWTQYTEEQAKSDIARWESDNLPIDVWALDMNWRYTDNNTDRQYNHPNTELFPDFANNSTAWFDFLESKNLHTYFNDHPYPVNQQTSPQEVEFRWEGLTNWMDKGLSFWWFDHNWGFSIPPPYTQVPGNATSGVWDGLSNAVWGSHVYHETVAQYNKLHRPDVPAVTLTKAFLPDARPWDFIDADRGYDENPAHHRYPVWWTGDNVWLPTGVTTMVDQGVHALKPYVHSDCGGDISPDSKPFNETRAGLERWVSHCVLGTILRLHGADHRPWTFGNETEDVIRRYLQLRYRLVPALLAAGREAEATGMPLAARCDLYWPEYIEARTNLQYIHLGETLVSPVIDMELNLTAHGTWIPPGDWQDAWTGDIVTGPRTLTVWRSAPRIPIWHRRGGFIVIDSHPGTRVNVSSWDELTIEAFPEAAQQATTKSVFDGAHGGETQINMSSTAGGIKFEVSAGPRARSWVLRLHLRPGQSVSGAASGGVPLTPEILAPTGAGAFPFAGEGGHPQANAGNVAEFRLPSSAEAWSFTVDLQ